MIILKLDSDVKKEKRNRRILKRTVGSEKLFDYSRSGIVINNKPHFVISVSQDTLEDLEFQKLIYKYKGSVVVSENLEKIDWIKEILFDLKPFRKKILFESFKRKLESKDYINSNLLIIDYDLTLLSEITGILPFVKNIGILTRDENNTKEWENNCFSEYGVKPVFIRKEHFLNWGIYDVIADFEKIDDNKLYLDISGDKIVLYPFFKFLEVPEELKILENLDLSKTTICGAFKG